MKFTIGQSVEAIDDVIKGKVTEISDKLITVLSDDGFEVRFRESELIPTLGSDLKREMRYVPDEAINEKMEARPNNNTRIAPKNRKKPAMEVDLHLHKLVTNEKQLEPFEKLNIQLETAERRLQFAISKHIQRVVFIHGVGAGVLKAELETLFRRYDNVKYYDADFQKYGVGATEVYIYQNVNR